MGNAENMDNVNYFLERNSEFYLESIEKFLPECLRGKGGEKGYVNIIPDGVFDGFFICRMRRKKH